MLNFSALTWRGSALVVAVGMAIAGANTGFAAPKPQKPVPAKSTRKRPSPAPAPTMPDTSAPLSIPDPESVPMATPVPGDASAAVPGVGATPVSSSLPSEKPLSQAPAAVKTPSPRPVPPSLATNISLVVNAKGKTALVQTPTLPKVRTGSMLVVLADDEKTEIAKLKVSKIPRKGQALCEIQWLKEGTDTVALIRRTVREEEAGAPRASSPSEPPGDTAHRNASLLAGPEFRSFRATGIDALSGTSLDQSLTSLGAFAEVFVPVVPGAEWLNWFGFDVHWGMSPKVTLVAKDVASGTVVESKATGDLLSTSFLVRPTFKTRWLPRIWLATELHARTRENLALSKSGAFKGGTASLETTGPGMTLGFETNPLPFLFLGFDGRIPLARKATATDFSGKETTGTARRTEWAASAALRYQLTSLPNALVFEARSALCWRTDTIDVKSLGPARESQSTCVSAQAGIGVTH